jgi:hypothetical protein
MPTQVDVDQGRMVAQHLYHTFRSVGIHGRVDDMPEDELPDGVEKGSLEHRLFITLTVAIDYMRDSNQVWDSARQTFADNNTRYLFDPGAIHEAGLTQVRRDLLQHGLALRPDRDARTWHTIGTTLHREWQGDPRLFLKDCGWDAPEILARLKVDSHLENGACKADFPYLRGDKIGPLWLRMLRDNVGITELQHLEEVPIPVDRHIARATLTTGVVKGQYNGPLATIYEDIRQAWFTSVKGLKAGDRPMIALDVDEPLWHLSKYGCTDRTEQGICRHHDQCEAREFCTPGRVVVGKKNHVELHT